LIRGPEVLESTRRVDTIVLDKTGTVTTGEMTLLEAVVGVGVERSELLRTAGALESASEHPIARAIVAGASAQVGDLPVPDGFANVVGRGVRGTVDGHATVVGRSTLLVDDGLTIPAELEDAATRAAERGHTVVWAGWDGAAR